MTAKKMLGTPENVGSLLVPDSYVKRAFLSAFVTDWYAHADTFYFANFLAEYKNYVPAVDQLLPGARYTVYLIPIMVSAPGLEMYQQISDLGYCRVGLPGLFLLHIQHPQLFPVGRYVTMVDSPWILPSDRTGNRRTARIRRFWSPAGNRLLWSFGAGFLMSSLDVGDFVVALAYEKTITKASI